jgi:hypothetical protein
MTEEVSMTTVAPSMMTGGPIAMTTAGTAPLGPTDALFTAGSDTPQVGALHPLESAGHPPRGEGLRPQGAADCLHQVAVGVGGHAVLIGQGQGRGQCLDHAHGVTRLVTDHPEGHGHGLGVAGHGQGHFQGHAPDLDQSRDLVSKILL